MLKNGAEKLVQKTSCANITLSNAMLVLRRLSLRRLSLRRLSLRRLAYGANDTLTAMYRELGCESIADLKSQEPKVSAFVKNLKTLESLLLGRTDVASQISKMIGVCGVWKARP